MAATAFPSPAAGYRPAAGSSRAHLAIVAVLFVFTGLSWWWSSEQMRDMDAGPWTTLGTALGATVWFLAIWTVMMAAMMFPSIAPTVALYARMAGGRTRLAALLFPAGYLVTWLAAGLVAVAASTTAVDLAGDALSWDHAGQPLAAAILIAAAAYQLTPWKNVCLGKCRSPLGTLLGSWRGGSFGAFRMGSRNGAWCVGCCWALMASLFALGVMSVTRMAVLSAIIAAEKLLPWRRFATYGTSLLLLTLGVLLIISPTAIPGLAVPGHAPAQMTNMS
jgi:predicted metal-binding membrane protein